MTQETIDKLVFDRLAAHGSVFLPEVGSLKCVRIAATIADDGSGFTAPRYIIEYTPVPTGTAVTDLIARTGISAEEAEGLYRNWLGRVSAAEGTRYDIPDVGILDLYEGGVAVFATSDALTPYLNPFGQESAIPADEPAPAATAAIPVPPPFPAPGFAPKPVGRKQTRPSHKKHDGKMNSGFWKTMTIVLAFLLAFAIAIILLNPLQISGDIKSTVQVVRPAEVSPEPKPADTTRTASKNDAAADTTVYRDRMLLGVQAGSDKPYHIIAGSFKSKEKAENMRKEKMVENKDIVMLYDKRRDIYMISIARFATRKEAQRELNRLPILYYPESYWIYDESSAESK